MRARPLFTSLLGLVVLGCAAQPADWAITNVRVIDVVTGAVSEPSTILGRGNRIVTVGPSEAIDLPRHLVWVDSGGGYATPGMWDMHVHLVHGGQSAARLFVEHGVTGVRDMGGRLAAVDSIVARARADSTGPRVVRSGRWIDGQKELTDRYILATPAEGLAAVAELAEAGADHLKVHNGLPRDVFFAVAEEARARGLPLVGHIPMEVTPLEALDAGLVTVEHIATIFEGTLSAGLRSPVDQLAMMDRYLAHGIDTLAARFVSRGAWFTPTMVAYAVGSRLPELEATPDPRRRLLDPEVIERWDRDFPIEPYELDPRIVQFRRQGDTAFAAVVAALDAGGVPLLTASDLGGREIYPGSSLQEELVLMVERAGLAPLTALQAATINPVRYLQAQDSLGAIAPAMVADIVVFAGNPLDDIGSVRTVRTVVVDGRRVTPTASSGATP